MAQFANIMGMSHDQTKNFGSAVVDLGNHFATTEADITHMAMRIAGAGKQIGLSEADVLGLSTALSSMGINAEAGGTAISTTMTQIDNAVQKGGEKLELWAQLAGKSAEEFSAAWREDAVGALSDVLVGLANVTDEGGSMSLMLSDLGINAIRQTDALKRLAAQPDFLAKAVGTANDAWRENIALDKEVENRNNSMEAQLQILMNKLNAIAITVGEPLMEALLGVIDAAQPFIDVLASGAKAFADLDEDGQKLVLTAVAIAAAFGPLTTITGKLISGIGKQGEAWSKFAANLSTVKDNLAKNAAAIANQGKAMSGYRTIMVNGNEVTAKFNANTKQATLLNDSFTKTTKAQNAAVKASTVAHTAQAGAMRAGSVAARTLANALKAVAPILIFTAAIEVISAFADAFKNASEKAKEFDNATRGLSKISTSYAEGYRKAAGSLDTASKAAGYYAESLDDVRKAADDAIKSQSELGDKLASSWEEVGNKNAMVDEYVRIIDELTNKYGEQGEAATLSAEEQAKLQMAVDGLNGVMGTSYSVVDALNGKLNVSTDVIKANAEAWQQQAIAQALSAANAELMEQHIKNQNALTKANTALTNAQNAYNEAVSAGATDLTPWNDALVRAQAEVDRLTEADKAVTDEMDSMNKTAQELMNTYGSMESAIKNYIDATSDWGDALSKAEVDSAEFASTLSKLGISTEDLARIFAEQGTKGIDNFINAYKSGEPELLEFAKSAGINIGSNLAGGMDESKSKMVDALISIRDVSREQFDKMAEDAGLEGEDAMIALANAIAEGKIDAGSSAQQVKDEVSSRLSNWDSSTWGYHLVQNLAAGMNAAKSLVSDAANAIANIIAAPIKHSIPVEGVLANGGKGEAEWGKHIVENLAEGMEEGIPALVRSLDDTTDVIADRLGNDIVVDVDAQGRAIAKGIVVGFEAENPMQQITDNVRAGLSAISIASAGGTTYNNTRNQTVNFTGGYNSPQEITRALRLQEMYGLAGDR